MASPAKAAQVSSGDHWVLMRLWGCLGKSCNAILATFFWERRKVFWRRRTPKESTPLWIRGQENWEFNHSKVFVWLIDVCPCTLASHWLAGRKFWHVVPGFLDNWIFAQFFAVSTRLPVGCPRHVGPLLIHFLSFSFFCGWGFGTWVMFRRHNVDMVGFFPTLLFCVKISQTKNKLLRTNLRATTHCWFWLVIFLGVSLASSHTGQCKSRCTTDQRRVPWIEIGLLFWVREIKRWMPVLRVSVLYGRRERLVSRPRIQVRIQNSGQREHSALEGENFTLLQQFFPLFYN